MRFATYEEHGRSRVATVGDDGVLHPHPGSASLLDLIQAGPEALREAGVPDAWYVAPTFYFTNPYAVIGAHDEVPEPVAIPHARSRPRTRP